MGNVYIFFPFGSPGDTSPNFLTLSYGVLSCLLRCKIIVDLFWTMFKYLKRQRVCFKTDNLDKKWRKQKLGKEYSTATTFKINNGIQRISLHLS